MKIALGAACLFSAFFFTGLADAGHIHREKEYQEAWCLVAGGQAEVVLPDRTRVDCLTEEYAVEVDFAPKWAEAIGQSLFYAASTNRKPGVVLIIEKNWDERFVRRLEAASQGLGIRLWTITPEGLEAGAISAVKGAAD